MLHFQPRGTHREEKHAGKRARHTPQRRMECPGCDTFKLCLWRESKRIWQCPECRTLEDGRERS